MWFVKLSNFQSHSQRNKQYVLRAVIRAEQQPTTSMFIGQNINIATHLYKLREVNFNALHSMCSC